MEWLKFIWSKVRDWLLEMFLRLIMFHRMAILLT